MTLTYRRPDGGAVVVDGLIDLAAFHDTARGAALFSGTEADQRAMYETLMSTGWSDEGYFTRSWTLRSDLDRSDLKRTVDACVALIAPLYGDKPTEYRLTYRPPGEEDAGTAQFGCLLAIPSILVGDLIGLVIAFVVGWSLELLIGVAVFALILGFVIGFVVLGTLTPRILALVPALRWQAADLGMGMMLFLPGLVTLGTWLVVALIGFGDGRLLFNISFVIVIGGIALSIMVPVSYLLWERWRQ